MINFESSLIGACDQEELTGVMLSATDTKKIKVKKFTQLPSRIMIDKLFAEGDAITIKSLIVKIDDPELLDIKARKENRYGVLQEIVSNPYCSLETKLMVLAKTVRRTRTKESEPVWVAMFKTAKPSEKDALFQEAHKSFKPHHWLGLISAGGELLTGQYLTIWNNHQDNEEVLNQLTCWLDFFPEIKGEVFINSLKRVSYSRLLFDKNKSEKALIGRNRVFHRLREEPLEEALKVLANPDENVQNNVLGTLISHPEVSDQNWSGLADRMHHSRLSAILRSGGCGIKEAKFLIKEFPSEISSMTYLQWDNEALVELGKQDSIFLKKVDFDELPAKNFVKLLRGNFDGVVQSLPSYWVPPEKVKKRISSRELLTLSSGDRAFEKFFHQADDTLIDALVGKLVASGTKSWSLHREFDDHLVKLLIDNADNLEGLSFVDRFVNKIATENYRVSNDAKASLLSVFPTKLETAPWLTLDSENYVTDETFRKLWASSEKSNSYAWAKQTLIEIVNTFLSRKNFPSNLPGNHWVWAAVEIVPLRRELHPNAAKIAFKKASLRLGKNKEKWEIFFKLSENWDGSLEDLLKLADAL